MLRDLIAGVEKWDLAPELASLWWTSTCEPEEKSNLSIDKFSLGVAATLVVPVALLAKTQLHQETLRIQIVEA